MGKNESMRRTKRRGYPIVRGDRSEVSSVEIVQLPNEKVDVVRGEGVVFLQVVESNEGKSGRKIPPKDVNRRARVLGGVNNMHHWGVEGKGRGDMNLDYDQGVVMDSGTPLKVMECTKEERRGREPSI